MNTPPQPLWRGPRWTLALLLGALASFGPLAIDAYLPAFVDIAASVTASPAQMQQTLSGFFVAMGVMNLFHGVLSDSLGRRPLVLWNTALFGVASAGCALSDSVSALLFWRVLQGCSAGSGMVLGRAIVRDLYEPVEAQRLMSQSAIFHALAPVLAPLIGGVLLVLWGWHAIFWFLAVTSCVIWFVNWRWLPETLAPSQRQPLVLWPLMRVYSQLLRNPRFVALTLASSVPFNAFFIYILSAPVFLGESLQLAPTQFFWFFMCTVSGIMGGAAVSGRLAGRVTHRHQVRLGMTIMALAALANVALNAAFVAHVAWAMFPMVLLAFGWALVTPVISLLALDIVPERRGMASSLQSGVGSFVGGLVAGLLSPWVMHSTLGLAVASLALLSVGVAAWVWVKPRL